MVIERMFIFGAGMWTCTSVNGELTCSWAPLYLDDIICPGATIGLEISTGYNPQAPRVPYEVMTILNLSVDFKFVAAD